MHSHWGTARGLGTDGQSTAERKGQEKLWGWAQKTVTEAEMAEQFRSGNVRAILDLGVRRGESLEKMRQLHDYAIETSKAHSDAILGNWFHIDPGFGIDGVREFRRCIDKRGSTFLGLAVAGAGFNVGASDPSYEPFYELCAQAGIPVLIMVGTTAIGAGLPAGGGVRLEFSHPRHLDEAAAAHPELKILAGRPGWPWQAETNAVVLHKNLYYELHGWAPKHFTPELKREISRRMKDRVMFGADYPMLGHERLAREWQEEGYAPDILERVFHRNAETFLGSLGFQ